jgi:hypothetical protein
VSRDVRAGVGPGPGLGLPPPNTGSVVLDTISRVGTFAFHVERRVDPFFRPALDRALRGPLERLLTGLINRRREHEGLGIAQERLQPGEEALLDDIIETFTAQMRDLWNPGHFERGGNTKTHGVVRAEFVVRDDVPEHLRHGVLATPRSFPAWVRFSGPGPWITPDIDDIGFLSIGVKLMDVEGPKLMDDEQRTQDFLCVPTPTFVTPDTRANTQLQHWSLKRAPLFYFFNIREPHVLDALMQMLWTRTQTSPLECDYFSCVPYLLGEGQAVQLSFRPRLSTRSRVPRLPLRPPDDYLRNAMAATLAREDVEFDFLVQPQTDPFLMPIENNGVLWPTSLSPRVPVAVLKIPRQRFDSPEQMAFARVLSYNPWHCLSEHRPLGNQSRARRRMYYELARLRMQMNAVEHYEPTGDEVFP